MKDIRFPKSYKIAEGIILHNLLCKGEDWQIYSLKSGSKVLVVTASLYEFWKSLHLVVKTHFDCTLFDDILYFYFLSDEEYELTSINTLHDFVSEEEGFSYAVALKETRRIIPTTSLKNGIFAERISRILPMRNEIEPIADEIILGTWLTGGLMVPVTSARRMLQVQPCLDADGLQKITAAAGLVNEQNYEFDQENQQKKEHQQLVQRSTTHTKTFSLPGRQELESFLLDNVIDIIEHPDSYAAMNIPFPGAFILQGPPGCGKTYAVEQLVEYLDWPVYYIESGTIGSSFIHETSKKISAVFKEAMDNAPSVLVIDEMESFLSTRSQSTETGGHHKEEIAEFLRKIPEAAKNKVLVIGMTNMIDSIDPAIRRRGRFDNIIEVGMPSAEEVHQVIDSMLKDLPHDEDIDIDALSEKLEGSPMSDVAFVIREAARLTAKNHLKSITQEIITVAAEKTQRSNKEVKRTIGFFSE